MRHLLLQDANQKKPFDPGNNPDKDPNPADQIPSEEKDPKKYC